MERQLTLEEIKEYNYVDSNTVLDRLLSKLKEFDFDDFLYLRHPFNDKFFKLSGLFDKLDRELYSRKHLDKDSKEYKEFRVSIFKSSFSYFENGVKNVDLVSFLLFFRVNSFLNMDIDYLVKNSSYASKFNNLLWNLAFEMGKINILMMDLDSCNHHKNSAKKWEVVFASKDLESLNSMFKLINLGEVSDLTNSPDLISSYLSLELISFLKEHDYSLFIRTILELDDFLAIVLFVKLCTFEDIECICKNNEIKNELLMFCFIKKFLDEKYDIVKDFSYLVKDILIQIFYSNKKLFNNLIDLFHDKELFNDAIGLFICDLSKGDIQNIITQLPIKWFYQNKDYRRKILESCNQDSKKYSFLLNKLYEKRRVYLKELLKNDDTALILKSALTDLCSCDLFYYIYFFNDEEIIIKITEILHLIKDIDSEWFYSDVHCTNMFYVYYSDLLILSIIYNFKNLKNDDIKGLFEEVIKNDFIEDLMDEKDVDSLKTIEHNILMV